MNYIYIILFVLVIGILYFIHCNYNETKMPKLREKFTNSNNISPNLISPSDFRERIQPTQKIGTSIGYSVIPYPNPGGSSFVLKHTKEVNSNSNDYYRLEFTLTPGLHYHFRYFYSNNLPTYINIPSVEVLFLNDNASNTKIAPDVNVSNTIEIGSTNWELRNINFQVPETSNGKTQIVLGGISDKALLEYFTDLYLVKTSPYLLNFPYTNNLNLFINGKNNSHNKSNLIKDLSLSGNDLIFDKNISYEGFQVALNQNKGVINDAGQILDSNRFSILWNAKIENTTGRQLLFEINANNTLNKGLKIFYLPGSTASDNKMEIEIRRFIYKYNIGIIQTNTNYGLLYANDVVELYVDGVLIEPYERVDTIDEPNLGTCPDEWRLETTNNTSTSDNTNGNTSEIRKICKTITGKNDGSGKCSLVQDFTDNTTNTTKKIWASECNVNWTNCDVLGEGNLTATNGKTNCVIGDQLDFSTNKILINPSITIRGLLSYLLIYNIKLDLGVVQNVPDAIYKYMHGSDENKKEKPIWDSLLDGVINRKLDLTGGPGSLSPQEIKNRSDFFDRATSYIQRSISNSFTNGFNPNTSPGNLGMGQFQPGQLCPFLENEVDSPCVKGACETAQWADLDNIRVNAECASHINNYCRNNTRDASCIVLRQKAVAKRRQIEERFENFKNCAACTN